MFSSSFVRSSARVATRIGRRVESTAAKAAEPAKAAAPEAPSGGTVQVHHHISKSKQCVPRHIAPNIALRQAYMSFHSGSAISAAMNGACCVRTLLALLGLVNDGERCRLEAMPLHFAK